MPNKRPRQKWTEAAFRRVSPELAAAAGLVPLSSSTRVGSSILFVPYGIDEPPLLCATLLDTDDKNSVQKKRRGSKSTNTKPTDINFYVAPNWPQYSSMWMEAEYCFEQPTTWSELDLEKAAQILDQEFRATFESDGDE